MVRDAEIESKKYKLLGFEGAGRIAVIMIVSTGKVLKVKLDELIKSEVMDDLNREEIKSLYRKFYSSGAACTAYELADRHERSWMIYLVLNLLLVVLYIFSNIGATKLIYLELLDIVVTPGVFLYPLTFLVVDLLNESYGFKLAKRAILFAFACNAAVILLLSAASYFTGVSDWKLDLAYGEVMSHVSSVLLASSVSFLFSEYVNSYLLCKIKELTNSRHLFLRVFFSTLFAVVIDTLLFCFIAFYGRMEINELMAMIAVQVSIKIAFAFFNVLPAYGARSLFKRYVGNNGVT